MRQRSSLLFDVFAASQQVKSLLTRAMAGAGLRPDEYAVYSGLFEFGPIAPTELATVVGMPATTLSHYIGTLRERGHLAERRDPHDGRSRTLSLTASGLAAHRRAGRAFSRAYEVFLARIEDPLTVKALLEAVERAARNAQIELNGADRSGARRGNC